MASASTHGDYTDCGSSQGAESKDLYGFISEADKVLYSIEGILDQMRPENIYVLKDKILNAGITSGDILEGVTWLIFEKAVSETTICPMYAELCCILSRELPPIPSAEPYYERISFRRSLINLCQHTFEGYDDLRDEIKQMTAPHQESQRRVLERMAKLRAMGNIRLIGELFKQNMIAKSIIHRCIKELLRVQKQTDEDLELVCRLLNTAGKQLERKKQSLDLIDSYFAMLKKRSSDPNLASRVKLMIKDVVHLRANNWIRENEEVKGQTVHMYLHRQMSFTIHSEGERKWSTSFRTTSKALEKPPTDHDKK